MDTKIRAMKMALEWLDTSNKRTETIVLTESMAMVDVMEGVKNDDGESIRKNNFSITDASRFCPFQLAKKKRKWTKKQDFDSDITCPSEAMKRGWALQTTIEVEDVERELKEYHTYGWSAKR
ncbi:hypothetical protein HELRODRAFT_171343 [Helobdella robusta]|uniref:Uncharacterized protein n=1 Tax=Helobdella robusta TaxID=6412 RepID=T1F454_HELRO|nr:hypothetical protein HELRODRAFT_171343 [Helobdella robusta]ESO05683.1 hypothetical protein HELRODRAFT_171343 [Helobdella robusta]